MIPIDALLLFFAASVALALAPGPDNIFVLTQSAINGRRSGLIITLGLCTGLLFHISAVALGVAAIFKTSILAFTILKTVGAAYLLYLAWQAFRAGTAELPNAENQKQSGWALYARGILMNITNPKVAIFFLSFLPQFADPSHGSIPLQIIMLGMIFILAAMIVFGFIAWSASYISHWLNSSKRGQLLINRVAGVVFVALACRLALSKQ